MASDGSIHTTTKMVEREIFIIDGRKLKANMGANFGYMQNGNIVTTKALNQIEVFRPNALIRASKLVEMAGISNTAFGLIDANSGELNPSGALSAAISELATLTKGGGFLKGIAVDLLLMASEHYIRANKGEQEQMMINDIMNGSEDMTTAMRFIDNTIDFENGSSYEMLTLQNNTIGKLLTGEITDLSELRLYDIENGDLRQPTGAILIEYTEYSDNVNVLSTHIGTNGEK